MTTIGSRPPLVRPRFAKWSLVVFILLLPFAIHAAWDYIAARRLKTAIDAIVAKGEPVGLLDVYPYQVLSSEAAESARYYSAAAALAAYDGARNSNLIYRQAQQVEAELSRGGLSDQALEVLRDIVADGSDALRLLDHATPLIFEGFLSATDFSYRSSQFQRLERLAAMRTALMIHEGTGDAAADSLYGETRLRRASEQASSSPTFEIARLAPRLPVHLSWVLSRTRPSTRALSKLAQALGALDRDDRTTRYLLHDRARMIDATFGSMLGTRYAGAPPRFRGGGRRQSVTLLIRPWVAGQLKQQLDIRARAIAVADKPWPERIDAIDAALPASEVGRASGLPRVTWTSAAAIARDTALLRCARMALAVARYRLDHAGALPQTTADLVPQYLQAPPIDPFSGQPLKVIPLPSGYAVYTVGTNRKDDGGRFDGTELADARNVWKRLDSAADFGLRISIRR